MKEDAKKKTIKDKGQKNAERNIPEEKRKNERLKEQHDVTITIVSDNEKLSKMKKFYHLSKDLSGSGVKLSGDMFLPVDTTVKMELKLENLHQKIIALGRVKWIKTIVEDVSYEAGVEFVDTSEETIRKIEDYISWKQQYKSLNPIGMPFWVFAKFNKTK
ncbi:MAG TPA: PilZ domain-containing protein [Smithella sp.]|nr:PilZ domain-containing protein [Smithella sp.]HRS96697.1 PilZ domain-containing protein [Smithella sp.]